MEDLFPNYLVLSDQGVHSFKKLSEAVWCFGFKARVQRKAGFIRLIDGEDFKTIVEYDFRIKKYIKGGI